MKPQSKAIHTQFQQRDAYGALAMPVYNTAAYEFDDATVMADAFCGRIDMPDYSRVTNPTVIYFEKKVKELTAASSVSAFTSGMAAISAVLLSACSQGKNIVSSRHLFGNTYLLLTDTLRRFGVEARLCDLTNPTDVRNNIDDNTCAIFLEIVTNPQLEVADLRELAKIAHSHNIPLIADTTIIPFTRFSAKELGVDFEVVSSTKYLSGGATSIGGLTISYGQFPEISKRIVKEMLFNLGGYMSPQTAYMQTLGLETLAARYDVQAANAQAVAEALTKVPEIKRVNYIGLKDNPYHDLASDLFNNTFGAMMTIDLASQDHCFKFINKLKMVKRATNLFDNRSLAIHPASTIFGPLDEKTRHEMDINDTTIRLSIGLEHHDDIIEDIKQAVK